MTDAKVQEVLDGIWRTYGKEIYEAAFLEVKLGHMTKVAVIDGKIKITSMPPSKYQSNYERVIDHLHQYPPQPKP